MPAHQSSLADFKKELSELVAQFKSNFAEYKGAEYNEARLRHDFLNPLFLALGWDISNRASLIQSKREVEIESATLVGSSKKRADYLFRTDGRDRFVCEAKKPREELHKKHIFQTKRYAWNKDLPFAVLTDFEETKFYIVGSRPDSEEPAVGELKTLHFSQYEENAELLWNYLSRESVGSGYIDRLIDDLPKKAAGKGRARQGYLIKPDRTRALDSDFLNFLDEARQELASSLVKHNDRETLLADGTLNAATQKILDRILFLRICEDRDIDTGVRLETLIETWQKENSRYAQDGRASGESLYRCIVRHFRELDRRPPTNAPYFNGQLFKKDASEDLEVGDEFLIEFIRDLSDESSPYLFNVIPVEILGSVYERFLGKVVRLQGRGATIEEKPEVRKAGGVYYTPRYIVDYIVEETVGKALDDAAAAKDLKIFTTRTENLRFVDPACGSGSFLIRAFERTCEHWEKRLTDDLPSKNDKKARDAWEKRHRNLCSVEQETNAVRLTVDLKRQILTNNIYGVDLDAAAVEVTQLSLYLKMLESENRTTLKQSELLRNQNDRPLLPPLQDNIKRGNSLIASDFSLNPEDLIPVQAFDWQVQFRGILKNGGFDAVIGNPPYVQLENIPTEERRYYTTNYGEEGKLGKRYDLYQVFVMRGIALLKMGGRFGNILPNTFLMGHSYELLRKRLVQGGRITELVDLPQGVFADVVVDNVLLFFERASDVATDHNIRIHKLNPKSDKLRVASKLWDETFEILQANIGPTEGYKINVHTNPTQAKLFEKIEGRALRLGDVTESSQGIILYKTEVDAEASKYTGFEKRDGWKKLLRGKNIARYETLWGGEFVSYGEWLWCAREEKYFTNEKILLHAMRNKSLARRLVATLDTAGHYNAHNLANIIMSETSDYSLKFVLAVFNSKLINYWYRAHFPNVNINPSDFREIPIPKLDLTRTEHKSAHDKLTALVEKMLLLLPKKRNAKNEAEQSTLQNAVAATDQQIDGMVYSLFDLTDEEIELVELGTT